MSIMPVNGNLENALNEERRLKNFQQELRALTEKYRVILKCEPKLTEVTLKSEAGEAKVSVLDAQLRIITV